jgi:transposase
MGIIYIQHTPGKTEQPCCFPGCKNTTIVSCNWCIRSICPLHWNECQTNCDDTYSDAVYELLCEDCKKIFDKQQDALADYDLTD